MRVVYDDGKHHGTVAHPYRIGLGVKSAMLIGHELASPLPGTNPRKQLKDMPRRYWKYITEKQWK